MVTGRLPRGELLAEFARFSAAGLTSFAVDLAALFGLRTRTELPLAADAAIAFLLASLVNFALARQWVFEQAAAGAHPTAELIRYGLLSLFALGFTTVSVPALALVMNLLAAKLLSSGMGAALNYIAMPRWVFTARRV